MPRLAAILAAAAALLLLAAAPAQAQTDERANARAFADAALRAQAAVAALEPQFERLLAWDEGCANAQRVPDRRAAGLGRLFAVATFPRLGALLSPPLMQLSLDLHAVDTADPALRSGRTAWRRLRRVYARFAAVPEYDVCAEIARWARGGYEPTPALRAGRRIFRTFREFEIEVLDRRMMRAVARLRELGIARRDAAAFGGASPDQARAAIARAAS